MGRKHQEYLRVYRMRRKDNCIVIGIVIFTGLLLAACAGASQPVESDPFVDAPPQQQEGTEGAPAGNMEVSEGKAAPTSVSLESAPADVQPTPRPELIATDPSTVNLASGSPQVLEFFAFW
jgi:hypothetical protein